MKVDITKVLMLFFLVWAILLNSGCSDSNLSGDVFVVKGNGDVKPLAGGKVYLLPYKSESEFLYDIANNTYTTIIQETSEAVNLLTQPALKFAKEQKEQLDKEVASINEKYPTPPIVCDELEGRYKAITQKTAKKIAQLTEKNNKFISQLQKEIKTIQSDKNKAIRQKANEIETRIRNKITTSVSQDGFTVKCTINNNTPYGIVLKDLILYFNEIKIRKIDTYYVNHNSTVKDEYGFDTNVHIMPNKSRTLNDLHLSPLEDSIPYNPEVKLLYKTGKLIVVHCYGRIYPVVNKARIKYDLYKISSRGNGNKIVYRKTPVNFTALALKENSFSSFENKITKTRQLLDAENKKFKNNDTIKQKQKILKELSRCRDNYAAFKKDTAKLSEINEKILKITKVIDILDSPKAKEVNGERTSKVIKSTKILNADFGGSFKLPPIDDKYTKLVTYNLAKKLSESKQTDTSIKGAYSFTKVKNGNYLLISEYTDNFVHGFWVKEVTLDKDTKIDLNNNSMVDMPMIECFTLQLISACKGCTAEDFKKSLHSKYEISEIEKAKQEAANELKKLLESLKNN